MPRMALLIALVPPAALKAADDEDPWFDNPVAGPGAAQVAARPSSEDQILRRKAPSESDADGADGTPVAGRKDDHAGVGVGGLRTSLSLAAVVALIVMLGYLSRKVSFRHGGRRPGVIEIISRTALSSKQSLCLVRIGPRLVLIGASGDRISRLDVIDDPELSAQIAGRAEQSSAHSSTRAFSARLSDETLQYADDDEHIPDVAAGPRTGRDAEQAARGPALIALKARLAGTMRRLAAKRSA